MHRLIFHERRAPAEVRIAYEDQADEVQALAITPDANARHPLAQISGLLEVPISDLVTPIQWNGFPGVTMDELGNRKKQEIGRAANERIENSHLSFRQEKSCSPHRADRETTEVRLRSRQRFTTTALYRHLVDRQTHKERRSGQVATDEGGTATMHSESLISRCEVVLNPQSGHLQYAPQLADNV
jgi:hypothetical protein